MKWTDRRGENVVAGIVKSQRAILSIGYGHVVVPVGARVFRAQRPKMVQVGVVE